MDDNRLDHLEERIQKAADLIRALKEERASLQRRIEDRDAEIGELQEKVRRAPGEDLLQELESLRRERKEILKRVNRMLALLDEGEVLSGEQGLLAAVEASD